MDKRKVSRFGVAQKAISTSSASTRFRAEDDPEDEDIRLEPGRRIDSSEDVVEQTQEARFERRFEEEKALQDRLLVGIPPERHAEALRRYREEERRTSLDRRELEDRAAPYLRGGLSDYGQEDLEAKRVRQLLIRGSQGVTINPDAENVDLVSSGPTYQGLGEGHQTSSLEDQLTTVRSPGEFGVGGRVEPEEGITRESIKDIFPQETVVWDNPKDKEKVEALVAKRNKLRALERRIKEVQQRAIRERPTVIDPKTKRHRIVDPNEKLKKEVQAERARVEQELIHTRPSTIVEGEKRTAKETARLAAQRLNEALNIPDPLSEAKPRGGKEMRPSIGAKGTQPPLTSKGLITDEQRKAYIAYTVRASHAPTHALREDAAKKAQRIANQVAGQVQEEVKRRKEAAAIREIRRSLIPPEDPSARYLDTAGIRPFSDIQRVREEAEARMIPAPPLPPPPRTPFEGALRTARGEPPRRSPSYPKPVEDPRLNTMTVEDAYRVSNHERVAPRFKWEVDRLKKKLTRQEVIEPKPKPFEAVIQQGKFIRDQARARTQGFIQGTEVLGFNENGRPMAFPGKGARTVIGSSPKARAGVTPNIQYQYQLRNPSQSSDKAIAEQNALEDLLTQRSNVLKEQQEVERPDLDLKTIIDIKRTHKRALDLIDQAIERQQVKLANLTDPIIKRVSPADTRTKFNVGKRDRFGKLYPDEFDEIVSVKEVPWQQEGFIYREGRRQLKGPKERALENIDEIRYVGVPGAKGEHRTVDDPEGVTKTITQMRTVRGQWVEVPRREYEEALKDRQRWENTPQGQARGTAPPAVQETSIPRKIQYKYVDPEKLELAPNQKDIASLRFAKHGRLNERLGHLQFGEEGIPKYVTPFNIPVPRADWDLLGQPVRVYAQAQKLDVAKEITTNEVHRLRATGLDAQGIANKMRISLKTIKALENEVPSSFPEDEARLQERHGIRSKSEAAILAEAALAAGFYAKKERLMKGSLPTIANKLHIGRLWGTYTFPVNEAFVRPPMERIAQIPYMARHPLSSVTGEALGLGVDTFKYRQEGVIPINPQVMARRALERQTQQLKRIEKTAGFVEKHKEDIGPLGTYTRWRLEPLSRARGYVVGAQQGMLPDAAKASRGVVHDNIYTYFRFKTNQDEPIHTEPIMPRPGEVLTKAQIKENIKRAQTRQAATNLLAEYNRTKRKLESNPFSPALRGSGPNFFKRAVSNPGLERNVLVGGAVVGTAVGAAYLYHRHKENKKPENQRVAFYNKVLPPAFETPKMFPHIRATSFVTFGNKPILREIGLAGKQLPTQVGASLSKKRITFRPMDKPAIHGSTYDPNLPIVGNMSFRGTPGGSKRKGLIYYGTDTPKRTSIRRSTHEVRVLGKRLPGAFNIGELKPIPLRAANPRGMSSNEMDNIIWAHMDTPLEDRVKAFYQGQGGRNTERLLERWQDPDEIDRIRRQKGRATPEYRQSVRAAVRARQRVAPAQSMVR